MVEKITNVYFWLLQQKFPSLFFFIIIVSFISNGKNKCRLVMGVTWPFYSESFLYEISLILFTPRSKDVLIIVKKIVVRFVLKYTKQKIS